MRRAAASRFLLLVVLAGSACDGAPKPTPVPPKASTTVESACEAYQAVVCEKLDECSHFLLAATWGDMGRCQKRGSLRCTKEIAPPDSAVTPAWLDGCAKARRVATCTELFDDMVGGEGDALVFLGNGSIAACKPPAGRLAAGAGCTADAQCQSHNCARQSADDGCGKCGPALPPIGHTPLGGVCASHADCAGFRRCDAGVGKCVTGQKAGLPCDPAGLAAPECDRSEGLVCDPETKTCRLAKVELASGQTCSDLKPCGGALRCASTKLCAYPLPDGAECETPKGHFCEAPARCVDEKCVVPDPGACK